jgi:hypothetical protein
MQKKIPFPISGPRGKIPGFRIFPIDLGGPSTILPSFSFLPDLQVG